MKGSVRSSGILRIFMFIGTCPLKLPILHSSQKGIKTKDGPKTETRQRTLTGKKTSLD